MGIERTNAIYFRFGALMNEVFLGPKAHRELLASQLFRDFAALYPVEKAQVETLAAKTAKRRAVPSPVAGTPQ